MSMVGQSSGWWQRCQDAHWPLFIPLLLLSPSLFMGFALDDYFHQVILSDRLEPFAFGAHPLLDLFAFLPADEQVQAAMRDTGLLPWWAPEGLRASFFRPVTAMSHWLDFKLWPHVAFMHHLHNLLWLALAAWAVRRMYRKMDLSGNALALAVFFFLLEDAHVISASWIANRNILIAVFFGCLTIQTFVEWRRDSGLLIWPVLWMAMSLLSAEAGLGTFGYILAWTLVYERGWLKTVHALAPFVILIILWKIPHGVLGYGTWGTGLYDDPVSDPLGFSVMLLQRLPTLMIGLWAQCPTEVSILFESPVLWGIAGVGVVLLVILFRVFRSTLREDPRARFWALGLLFSMIPVCATLPMNRLLFFPGLGAYALMGLYLSQRERPTRHVLFWVHGPIAAVLCVAGVFGFQFFKEGMDLPYKSLPSDLSSEDHVIYLVGSALPAGYSVLKPKLDGDTYPARVSVLAPYAEAKILTRLDEYTIAISSEDHWFKRPMERGFRSARLPFHEQRVFQGSGFVATITDMRDGFPKTVEYRFQKPLDHPNYRWTCFEPFRLFECALPRIGESMRLQGL